MNTIAERCARDMRDREEAALAHAEAEVRAEIALGFAQLTQRPAATIAVPSLAHKNGRDRETTQSVAEIIAEQMGEQHCMAELLHVLEHSPCPHVAALRDALAKQWADSWASDIAPLRAGL